MKFHPLARLAPAALTLALLGACTHPYSHTTTTQPTQPTPTAPAANVATRNLATNQPMARQAIALSTEEQAHVLAEMNEFLGTVHAINQALARKDFAEVARVAQAMGPRGGDHNAVGQRLHQKLPPGWFALARPTHQQFLAVARAAQSATTAEEVLKPLAATTQQCVTCHASYRLVTAP